MGPPQGQPVLLKQPRCCQAGQGKPDRSSQPQHRLRLQRFHHPLTFAYIYVYVCV